MNFDQAVASHQLWKTRLLLIISGESAEQLDPATACRDDQCELGKWIHGEGGRTVGVHPEFADLKALHAGFHEAAGKVLWRTLAGDEGGATFLLNGEFTEASRKVIRAIVRCKSACKRGR